MQERGTTITDLQIELTKADEQRRRDRGGVRPRPLELGVEQPGEHRRITGRARFLIAPFEERLRASLVSDEDQLDGCTCARDRAHPPARVVRRRYRFENLGERADIAAVPGLASGGCGDAERGEPERGAPFEVLERVDPEAVRVDILRAPQAYVCAR